MRNKAKKIFGIAVAAALLSSTVAFAGCSNDAYKGDKLSAGYESSAEVKSNGGFAVEKGEYVYFINGSESYTASNSYGDVVKGALMRISKTQLKEGKYSEAQTVVPSLFVAQNFNAGIYIYDDYVYYATPTSGKNLQGEVENSWIDFKRAKIDGTEAPMDGYYFRLSSNSANYRFVQAGVDRNKDGKQDVFCMYEEDGDLKSFNTATNETVTLVSGAKSSFFYDMKDVTNPNVYYTMAVSYNIDSENALEASYDQLYCVNAAARATVNADKASYTVEGGKTYEFDKAYMEKKNKDAKKADEDEPYKFSDYTTYPYVNLGTLVLDGVGRKSGESRFNWDSKADAEELQGFNYTISRYENGGVYFTRAVVSSSITDTTLYYLSDKKAEGWNTVKGNSFEATAEIDMVATDTTNASSTALFEYKDGVHSYIYVANSTLCRATANEKGEANVVRMARNMTDITLWKTEGNYLYYYAAGTNGNNLSRINYTGKAEDDVYSPILSDNEALKDYQPITISAIDWSDSWYKPEFIEVAENENVLLYPNAQSYGGGAAAYNYIYATKIGDTASIQARNDAYEAVNDYLDEYSDSTEAQSLINYYFRTDLAVSKESENEYDDELFAEITGKFAEDGELKKEKTFIGLVGKMKSADAEDIEESWINSLPTPKDNTPTEEGGLPDYAIVLIVVGSVVLVAGVAGIFLAMYLKKKKAAQREAEATVNAYKRKKIDTTDDKSIDVYADEEAQESTEETTEEATAEEVAEEVTETPVEAETTEEITEETQAVEETAEEVSEEEKTNE